MKLSVMQCTFHGLLASGKVSVKQLTDEFSANGVKAIEVMQGCILDKPNLWSEMKAAMDDHGMFIDCFDAETNFIGDGSKEYKQKVLDSVKRNAEYAREKLNCNCMLMYNTSPAPGMSYEDARKVYGEQLRLASEYGKEYGVALTIEDYDVTPKFSCSIEHIQEILALAGDGIRFTYDTGNFLYGANTPKEAFAAMADRTSHVHLKDYVLNTDKLPENARRSLDGKAYKYVTHGTGLAEVGWTVDAFQKKGYDGSFSIEIFTENVYADILASIKYYMSLFA